jgi:hypothetical protein
MRIYEVLGVKQFRKMVFGFLNIFMLPFTIKMTKEERREFLNSKVKFINYNIPKTKSLVRIEKFKIWLFVNAGIHIYALIRLMPGFLNVLSGNISMLSAISNISCIIINLYCIMLQRYNYIRINQFIDRMTPYYEKQKEVVKDELRKEDALFNEHTYRIVNKRDKEKEITFEELISNLSLDELKKYRHYLEILKRKNCIKKFSCPNMRKIYKLEVPIKHNKTLKLEINPNVNKNTFN